MRRFAPLIVTVMAAAVVIVFGPMFLDRGVSELPHPEREVRGLWQEQLRAVDEGRSVKIVMPDHQLHPSLLPELLSVSDRVSELNLSGEQLTREWKAILACHHLKILHLRTEIGDVELRSLAKLTELEVLDLPLATQVTDAGMKYFSGHPALKLVRLRAPRVTDQGVTVFSEMPALRWLHLMEVPVTDAGLQSFRSMPRLESLYLDGDRASDEGLSDLVMSRPDLHFHRDQVHLPSDPRGQDGHPE